jgi:mannonate dehydratase
MNLFQNILAEKKVASIKKNGGNPLNLFQKNASKNKDATAKKAVMNRRQAIGRLAGGTAGLAAATYGVAGFPIGATASPLGSVQDEMSSKGLPPVKITDVKLILTEMGRGNGSHMVNVKVLTSEPGLYGVGCGTHNERAHIVAETIDKFMKPMVVGRNVGDIEHIWQTAWVAPYWRASVDSSAAISAIDMALWDIMGKRAGLPVYSFLGGKTRNYLTMFTGAGGSTPHELEDGVRERMEQGFRHFRVRRGRGGSNEATNAAFIDSIVKQYDHLRNTIGWDIEIAAEIHEQLEPAGALAMAKAVEPYRPFFLEDLFAPEDVGWYKIIREQSAVPIAMGEIFVNQNEWLPLVANRYIDFIRTHISMVGGLSYARKCAACCEWFNVKTAWHGPGNVSPVGHAVNLHLDLAIPNFGIGEGGPFSDELRELFPGAPEQEGNKRYSNDLPGLGIDIDEKVAAKYPWKTLGANRGRQRADGSPMRP